MDPVTSPYAPGAGTPPPELAGRDELREMVRIAVERQRRGNPAKSVLLVGLRGVGKTVLLEQMSRDAERALRNGLISKGMVWSPNHGGTAFTVPLFDEFMKRIMPGKEWQGA